MRHALKPAQISAIALAAVAFVAVGPAFAQSSSLPPTNMGKFVHQPGDNQYSNNTQMERHAPPPPPPRPTAMPVGPAMSVGYVPVPRQAKPDPTLSYIAADEPVVQAGFPPLPDRVDLPGSGSSWAGATARSGGGGGWGGPGGNPDGGGGQAGVDSKIEKKSFNGYRHATADAYGPSESTSRHYRSSNPAGDSYSAGGGGGGGGNSNPAASLGKEPSLNPRADAGIVAEAPTPVVVKQATTQDLSLPDDEFSGSNQNGQQKKQGNRMMKQMGRQMFISPMMQMGSMGSSMAGRAIHF